MNALQKSNCKIPEEIHEVSVFSYESLGECIMASAPPFTPTRNCTLWKSSFASAFSFLAKQLAISLLKASPTLLGRIPPFFFSNADSDALRKLEKQIREILTATYFLLV